MVHGSGRPLRRPAAGANPHRPHRPRRAWWHPIADWAHAYPLVTGLGAAVVGCVLVGLVVGMFVSTPSSSVSASAVVLTDVSPIPTAPVTDGTDQGGDGTTQPAAAVVPVDQPTALTTPTRRATAEATPSVSPSRVSTRQTQSLATSAAPVVTATTSTPGNQFVVQAGAPCTIVGATGVTAHGTPVVCKSTLTDPGPRWHTA